MKKFGTMLKECKIEREVEDAYNERITFYFPGNVTHPFDCDGLVESRVDDRLLKLILEYKFDKDFKSRASRASVIVQVLYYVKRFEQEGLQLPNVVLVGDRNECFVFHVNDIISYLDEDVDWSIAPSSAADRNPDLVLRLANDESLNPFVFVIDNKFDFKAVADKIRDLATNVQRYVHVTEHNIATIFEYFKSRVVREPRISPNNLVSVFLGVIKNDPAVYVHPRRKNILMAFDHAVRIDEAGFKSFAGYFSRKYTPTEKMRFDEIADRLLEDVDRRRQGAFFTPTLFVDMAHRMIEEVLGADWKEKYVVWDPCWGTGNLTRDYKFKELYCSTLLDSELETGARYNPEAVKFQFDFLNDDLNKVPKELQDALEQKKPIVFFMNPPYATACNHGESKKESLCQTLINGMMKRDNYGRCSENLLAQFLYRCEKLKKDFGVDVSLAFFCNPIYLSGGTYNKFRDRFLKDFKYEDGFLFNAGHFSDTASSWGINFSIWTSSKTTDKNNFKHDLVDIDENGEIVKIGEKDIYNTDGLTPMGDWVVDKKEKNPVDWLPLTNGINVKNDGNVRGTKMDADALGYFHNNANSICYNPQYVNLFTSVFASVHGCEILPSNFIRCTSAFAARRLIDNTWINHFDEYMMPDMTNPVFAEFEQDSVIYSLFNPKSQQASLRRVEYKGKKYDIKNEFFWMPKSQMMELAEAESNDAVYDDARTSNERYVCTWLQDHELSPEAQAVLDKATELVVTSFKYRTLFNEDHPEYHINTWDAGYYQLKALWQQYLPDEFQEFKRLYKALADKMRPMVYELGFLRR